MELKLPEGFDSYPEARRNGFLRAKAIKEGGGHIAGTFCTFTPLEVIHAAGVHTVTLCATSDETVPAAEAHLPKNLCPLIKSSYGFALTDKCPYTYFSDIIIGETTCDGKKKMYELLGEMKDVHVMRLPQSVRDVDLDPWADEVRRLKERVEEKFGVAITDDDLRRASRDYNALRAAQRRVLELQRLDPAPVWGREVFKVLDAVNFAFDVNGSTEKLNKFADDIMKAYDEGARPVPTTAKRVLITGCPLGGVFEKAVGAIEDNGGVAVGFDNCNGIKPARGTVDTEAPDIIREIARRSLSIGCSVMTPNTLREEIIRDLVKDFRPHGIVEIDLQACHTYAVERRNIKRLADELGLPYASIETDYSRSDSGQITTRVSAFIEML